MKILLISGSTREASGNTAALRTVRALAPHGVDATMYQGLAALPAFNPDLDNDQLPAPVRDLRDQIASAGAVLFCTPEYAGTLPGSLKNLLDWTVGGGEMNEKPAAWINVANPGRGGGATATLASVLSYVGADVIDAACRDIPVPRDAVTPDGTVSDPRFTATVADIWGAVLGHLDAAS